MPLTAALSSGGPVAMTAARAFGAYLMPRCRALVGMRRARARRVGQLKRSYMSRTEPLPSLMPN